MRYSENMKESRKEKAHKTHFERFVYSLMKFMDERRKDDPHPEIIDDSYDRAEELFTKAVSEAVRGELERIELKVTVEDKLCP